MTIIAQMPPECQELELSGLLFIVVPGNQYHYYPYFRVRELRLEEDM